MKILKEFESSNPLPISVADDKIFSKLLKKELKLKTLTSKDLVFSSNGFCGVLTIANQSHYIIPQFGPEMLDVLLPLVIGINRTTFSSSSGLGQGFKFIDGIASIFISCYENIKNMGLRAEYDSRSTKSLFSCGTLQLKQSLVYLESGLGSPSWQQAVYELDSPLNRAIKFIFSTLIEADELSHPLRYRILNILDEVESVNDAIPDFESLLSSLNRTNEQYRPFLEFGSAFILGMGQGAGETKSTCCLFESWRVFQQAIKNAIAHELSDSEFKLNFRSSLSLKYTNEDAKKLDPDLIVYDSSPAIRLLGDIKYTKNESLTLDRNNMFQVNTYMDGYGQQRSILLYPSSHEFGRKEYKLRWGNTVAVYKIPVCSISQFQRGIKNLLHLEGCIKGSSLLKNG